MTKLAQLKAVYDELAKKRLSVGFLNTQNIPMEHLLLMLPLFKSWAIRLVAFLLAHFTSDHE